MSDMKDMLSDYLTLLYALCENDSRVQKTVLYQQNRNRDLITVYYEFRMILKAAEVILEIRNVDKVLMFFFKFNP